MFDVAIVGGGLAGCSAAIHLARQGMRVVLFESKTYPHHKVCGEVLSPECAVLLDELGVGAPIQKLHPAYMDTVCVTAPDGTSWESRLPGPAIGVSRYALDHLLADHAAQTGVDLRPETTVTAVEGSLTETFRLAARSRSGQAIISARAILSAHGKRGGLDRTLNRAFLRQPQPFIGLKAHFYGPPLPCRIELHTFPGGYCGLSEIEDGKTNACLLVREAAFRQAGDIDAFIAWMQRQNPRLGVWLSNARLVTEGWYSISQVPFVNKQAVENDVLMAGDAAGLIAPLAGNGMAMALRGGKLAAEHIGMFARNELTANDLRRRYAAAWKHEFQARLNLGRFLQAFMLRPTLLAFGLHLMNAVPPIGGYFIQHTRDSVYP
jgi:flavin-dependent dehydrogenase